MNVITPATLRHYWEIHPQAKAPLKAWLKKLRAQRYESLGEIRAVFPHADLARSDGGVPLLIFNIGGNDYRLVVTVNYQFQCVWIKRIFTHAEYTQWNDQGRPI